MDTPTATPAAPAPARYASLIQAMLTTFTQQVAAQVKQDIKSDNNAALQGVLALDPAAIEPLITSLVENDGDLTAALTALAERATENVLDYRSRSTDGIDEAIDQHKRDEDHISESDMEGMVDRAIESALQEVDLDDKIGDYLDSNLDDRLTTFLDTYDYPNESRVDEMIGEAAKQKVADEIIDWGKVMDETITLKLNAVLGSPAFHTRIISAMASAFATLVANSGN